MTWGRWLAWSLMLTGALLTLTGCMAVRLARMAGPTDCRDVRGVPMPCPEGR